MKIVSPTMVIGQNSPVKTQTDKVEGDSFSSEDEKFQITNTQDLSQSLLVRKKNYRFLSIIEQRNTQKKKKMLFQIPENNIHLPSSQTLKVTTV